MELSFGKLAIYGSMIGSAIAILFTVFWKIMSKFPAWDRAIGNELSMAQIFLWPGSIFSIAGADDNPLRWKLISLAILSNTLLYSIIVPLIVIIFRYITAKMQS